MQKEKSVWLLYPSWFNDRIRWWWWRWFGGLGGGFIGLDDWEYENSMNITKSIWDNGNESERKCSRLGFAKEWMSWKWKEWSWFK